MIISRRNQPGFATVFSLISLTLVGVTIGGLMTHIAMQARRTNYELHRAQLDQVRIAKAFAAIENDVVLPNEVQTQLK